MYINHVNDTGGALRVAIGIMKYNVIYARQAVDLVSHPPIHHQCQ